MLYLVLQVLQQKHSETKQIDFYDYGTLFMDWRLLSRDDTHLASQGKSIFASWLASLVRRGLN